MTGTGNISKGRIAAALLAAGCSCAHAQPGAGPSSLLVPVEPIRGDATPLSVSQRIMPVDLRQPLGFERVFRVDAQGQPTPAESSLFARKGAAITALFPQSLYEDTRWGPFVAVPPGTVFLIGVADEDLIRAAGNLLGRSIPQAPGAAEAPRSPWYADYSASLAAGESRESLTAHPGGPRTRDESARTPGSMETDASPTQPRTIWNDDLYRRERIAALLDAAAAN